MAKGRSGGHASTSQPCFASFCQFSENKLANRGPILWAPPTSSQAIATATFQFQENRYTSESLLASLSETGAGLQGQVIVTLLKTQLPCQQEECIRSTHHLLLEFRPCKEPALEVKGGLQEATDCWETFSYLKVQLREGKAVFQKTEQRAKLSRQTTIHVSWALF